MTDDMRKLLWDAFVLLFGGFSGFLIQHWRRRQDVRDEHTDHQAETIAKQGKTLADAFSEIDELRETLRKNERKQRIQWSYLLLLLEEYRSHGLIPPEPPEELKTDPDILRLTRKKNVPPTS